ncbi:MAG: hypothetical protein SGI99_17840 [Pseudomonadota bacterium]|nr:hypothetical protein [Pseudomonadota bacterium]
MQSFKSFVTPLVVAVVLGLGVGFGVAPDAQATTCRQQCTIEFEECRAEGAYPGFYRCRTDWSACLRACS